MQETQPALQPEEGCAGWGDQWGGPVGIASVNLTTDHHRDSFIGSSEGPVPGSSSKYGAMSGVKSPNEQRRKPWQYKVVEVGVL